MKCVVSSIKLNFPKINSLGTGAIIALEKTAEALRTEVRIAQVMPFDTGAMQNRSTFVNSKDSKSGKVSIDTQTPYARRMYFHPEYNFKKTENANAKGQWYDDFINGKQQDFATKTFAKFYKESAGIE